MALSVSAVIPVVQTELAVALIAQIAGNTKRPERIIIIDNSDEGFDPISDISVIHIRHKERIGVNESWNIGVSLSNMDVVAILNDDIIIGNRFFERMTQALQLKKRAAVACPMVVLNKWFVGESDRIMIVPMLLREGCAMVIKKEILDRIPKIPKELETFCGDDWYWYWTHRLGYRWIGVDSVRIFHYVGRSLDDLGLRDCMKGEKRKFLKIIERLEE